MAFTFFSLNGLIAPRGDGDGSDVRHGRVDQVPAIVDRFTAAIINQTEQGGDLSHLGQEEFSNPKIAHTARMCHPGGNALMPHEMSQLLHIYKE